MDKTILDINGLKTRTMDDIELAKEILECYLEETQPQLEQLRQAIESNDFNMSKEIAHGIKGSSATIGAMCMQYMAEQIQIESENKNIGKTRSLIKEIESTYLITVKTIQNLELEK